MEPAKSTTRLTKKFKLLYDFSILFKTSKLYYIFTAMGNMWPWRLDSLPFKTISGTPAHQAFKYWAQRLTSEQLKNKY